MPSLFSEQQKDNNDRSGPQMAMSIGRSPRSRMPASSGRNHALWLGGKEDVDPRAGDLRRLPRYILATNAATSAPRALASSRRSSRVNG